MTDTIIERSAGAAAISAKAMAIALGQEVQIVDCVWDIGADLTHEHAHRLELVTAEKSVRVYFRELELTTADNASRGKRIDERLQRAIAQLLQRAPAPTYGYN
ncbi:hypothetical protein PQR63_06940 [Herbaspirillum rhizosphaerae]|uniref:Uncharacterized protein n=1 Tax=Herbaspirillum rhizosphaerae TaxID=346179 RepID=A0ABW8Z593_9BURK